jgi:hypothetical protein
MVGLLQQRSKVTRHLDTFTASICWFTKRIYAADLKRSWGKNNNNSSSSTLLLLGDTAQDKEEILDSVVVLYINYYIPGIDENY